MTWPGTERYEEQESHRELPAPPGRGCPRPSPTLLGIPRPLQEIRAPSRPSRNALVLAKAGLTLKGLPLPLALPLVIIRLPIEALLLTLTLLLVAGLLRGVVCAAVEAVLRRLGKSASIVGARSEDRARGFKYREGAWGLQFGTKKVCWGAVGGRKELQEGFETFMLGWHCGCCKNMMGRVAHAAFYGKPVQ